MMRGRLRPSLLAGAALMLAIAVFWAWIFGYQLTNRGEAEMPDRLDDLTWTDDAEAVCAAAMDRIAALPPAPATSSATARAQVIDTANGYLEDMIAELEQLAPRGSGRDADITQSWLGDYRVFLTDRERYADALRRDPAARFVVTERYGSHITKPVDRFARVNEMESCMTPGDV